MSCGVRGVFIQVSQEGLGDQAVSPERAGYEAVGRKPGSRELEDRSVGQECETSFKDSCRS